jgi:hypothetical protein
MAATGVFGSARARDALGVGSSAPVGSEKRRASPGGTSGARQQVVSPVRRGFASTRVRVGVGLRRAFLGGALLLGLGCGSSSSTTGPRPAGLIIEALQLLPDGGECRLNVILKNRVGTDIGGDIVYNLVGAEMATIGTATVFPFVRDGETRSATSDILRATTDGHRLACSEIVSLQINPTLTSVPLASS